MSGCDLPADVVATGDNAIFMIGGNECASDLSPLYASTPVTAIPNAPFECIPVVVNR